MGKGPIIRLFMSSRVCLLVFTVQQVVCRLCFHLMTLFLFQVCDKELGYNNNTSSMLRHYHAVHEAREDNVTGAEPSQGNISTFVFK